MYFILIEAVSKITFQHTGVIRCQFRVQKLIESGLMYCSLSDLDKKLR